jgi:hypothetical protein
MSKPTGRVRFGYGDVNNSGAFSISFPEYKIEDSSKDLNVFIFFDHVPKLSQKFKIKLSQRWIP